MNINLKSYLTQEMAVSVYQLCLSFRMSDTGTLFLYKCRILTTGTSNEITIHRLTNIFCTGYQIVLTHQACSDPPGIREGPYLAPSSPPDTPLPTNSRPWAANALQRLYNHVRVKNKAKLINNPSFINISFIFDNLLDFS